MALQLPDGRYIKVLGPTVDNEQIEIIEFADRKQRERWERRELTDFEVFRDYRVLPGPQLRKQLEGSADGKKNRINNTKEACYNALKEMSEFAGGVDV